MLSPVGDRRSTRTVRNSGTFVEPVSAVYAENPIPSQIDGNRLAHNSQTAGGRRQQASLARDERG